MVRILTEKQIYLALMLCDVITCSQYLHHIVIAMIKLSHLYYSGMVILVVSIAKFISNMSNQLMTMVKVCVCTYNMYVYMYVP